ncbi:U3 snoRNP protein [Pichia californica]|uniref:U3 snoRNP protein n=1 Tax=Pichia californica TaxID=460514 RepID=A0A9P7BGN3_9ASCO|nr:U3 snoRNP protein [[Candida] californica]KAG0688969.1 U3 snoRNP protein [[Candida] californica]
MKSDFKFSNLLGTVYREGNIVFSPDGTCLLSPVGNRVSVFDLIHNKSYTLDYEHRKNITAIALNPQGSLLLTIDEDGRSILVNFKARTVLHHFNFKNKVRSIEFSPDGTHFAVAAGRFVEVWKTPDMAEDRQFAPFVRYRVYAGHYNDVTAVTWSNDSRFILSASKDMTARIFSLESKDKSVKMSLAGHRDYVVKAFFDSTQEIIYTVSKDGAIFRWEYTERPGEEELPEDEKTMSWRIIAKNFFFSESSLKCCTFHSKSNLLIVGFGNGEFRLYEMPSFTLIQQLSMGSNGVSTISINSSGEWIAFGSKSLGQLLVYEWQSESYILRQQGHFDSMNALAYSPDGSRIVTASDDGKIKIWDIVSGFCLATFDEHQSSVTGVVFAKKGQVMFSSSLDGTVRAWDLIRFRNFRTFTSTSRIQFSSVAVDPSGEIVVAGSLDNFDIQVWSVQTSQLLDQLSGHEGPISNLSFGLEANAKLASASWDKTVRIWDIFARSQTSEPFDLTSECLSLSMRPDSKEFAVSTMDGKITFFDIENGRMVREIDGKKDILQGRYREDEFTSANSKRGKHFTTIAYSFDGLTLIAAGNNNSICMYDLPNEVLLKRFKVSLNMQLNGTLEFLNSKNIVDGNAVDLVDRSGELSDAEENHKADLRLPGSHRGDIGLRSTKPEVRVMCVGFSPTANAFAAASTEGLLVYSVDDSLIFDPIDLDIDVTPENTLLCLKEGEYLNAIAMAFRLNERYLIHKVYEGIKKDDVALVANDLPVIYVPRLLEFIGSIAMESQHVEYNLLWIENLITAHGKFITKNKHMFMKGLRSIQRFISRVVKDIVSYGYKINYLSEFLLVSVETQELKLENDEDEDVIIEDISEPENEKDEEEGEINDEDDEDEEGGWFGPGEDGKKYTDNFSNSDSESDDEE